MYLQKYSHDSYIILPPTKGKRKFQISFAKYVKNVTTQNYSDLKIHTILQLFDRKIITYWTILVFKTCILAVKQGLKITHFCDMLICRINSSTFIHSLRSSSLMHIASPFVEFNKYSFQVSLLITHWNDLLFCIFWNLPISMYSAQRWN